MIREMRRAGARLLPEFVKAPLRGRLYGYTAAGVGVDFQILMSGADYLARLGDNIEIPITADEVADFSYHFKDNGASIEEMAGFLQAAKSARTLFDIGAHKGLFSLIFCACDPRNRAVAYEPSPILS